MKGRKRLSAIPGFATIGPTYATICYQSPYIFDIMNKILASLFCCLWIASSGFFVTTALAKNKAEIVEVEIGEELSVLKVSFFIQDCFTPSMEEAIRSGVSTTFRIRTVVEKAGVLFFSSTLLDVVLEHTIKYDYLKNEYHVQLPETPNAVRVTKDFAEAKQWMSTVQDLPVIPLWRLDKDQPYDLRIRAELSKVELPLFFRYIFFFVSLWDFDTEWYRITFTL
jgi:hypothetical protein